MRKPFETGSSFLKESGFLHCWKLLPNLALFGRTSYYLFLEFQNEYEKERAIPKIAKKDGVVLIARIYGNNLLVTVRDDPKVNSAKKVSELGGLVCRQECHDTKRSKLNS